MENKQEVIVEKEIDLLELGQKLWTNRKFIIKVSALGLVIGVIVAFSIPKEYTATVILAPESNSMNGGGSMGALAAVAGINLGGGSSTSDISMDIYPNIVESTPFLLGLSEISVSDNNKNIDTTLFTYIKDDQKKAWWSYALGLPGGLIGFFFSKDNKSLDHNKLELTKEQLDVINNLKNRVSVSVDKKTGVITLDVNMQDPFISASIADTLTSYLQSYIIKYRTEKARQDLTFVEQLYSEAKADYTKVQQKYADYLDRNQNVVLASYRVNQEKLQQEMALAYNVYTQIAQQLQLAKVKVQDETPVYTVIQPSIVPLIPSKPNKKLIVIGFVFIAFIVGSIYVLYKDSFFNK